MKIKTQQIFTFQIYEYVHDCHLLQSKHLKSKMKRADTIHDSAQMIVKTFDWNYSLEVNSIHFAIIITNIVSIE